MRGLAIMREFAPVVFDATHSVQLPSAGGDGRTAGVSPAGAQASSPAQSGGQPQFIPVLSRAAVAAGVDGIFMEVHDNPAEAKSDGANALDLKKLRGVLTELLAVRKAVTPA
jgi:2-dehydro-3-deoxyphosphooctonate aldolase (KDO 8-P synthase)